jgi:AcrR family transcriptional regulator
MPRPPTISREQIVAALVRVVAERGLEACGIRAVAAEAGVSAGAVQHHFASKDELLRAAYEAVIDAFAARVARHAGLPPRELRRALLLELLPLDAEREAELRVALSFTARSMHSPALMRLYTHGYERLVAAVAATLEGVADDPVRDARAAVALADGLAWHLLCAPDALSPDAALAALDAALA